LSGGYCGFELSLQTVVERGKHLICVIAAQAMTVLPLLLPLSLAPLPLKLCWKAHCHAIAGDHILVQGRLVQGKLGQGKVEMKPLTTGDCAELRRGQFEELPKNVFHYRNSSLWFRPIALPAVVGPATARLTKVRRA
jgi:hypothetical protein